MSKKLLVHITINIWESGIPKVTTEEVVKETEKYLYVKRTVHPRWRYGGPAEVLRECPVQRSTLGQVISKSPGVKKYSFVMDYQPDMTEHAMCGSAVTLLRDDICVELGEAGEHLGNLDKWIWGN